MANDPIRKGQEAERLMKDPLLVSILESMMSDVAGQWMNTDFSDIDTRERLYMQLYAVRMFRTELERAIANGKYEQTKYETKEEVH